VILGASSVPQLENNLDAYFQGPLPDSVIEAIDAANEACSAVCPKYYR
jgi:aryl-alcohol dehydrogenase-like predicted oxidoreductase